MAYKCKHDESTGLDSRYYISPVDTLKGFWSDIESKIIYPCISRPDLVIERNLALSVRA